jgi:membrane protein implicated in regulation of membrane protease activity
MIQKWAGVLAVSGGVAGVLSLALWHWWLPVLIWSSPVVIIPLWHVWLTRGRRDRPGWDQPLTAEAVERYRRWPFPARRREGEKDDDP